MTKFIIVILTLFAVSCNTTININNYINQTLPLELHKNHGIDIGERLQIPAHSDKFEKLVEWGNQNCNGWEQASATYDANIFVGQSNFRLLYSLNSDGVVIGFRDKESKPKQYSKTIKKGGLDFLVQP